MGNNVSLSSCESVVVCFVCVQAIQQPTNESVQEKAWTAVVPLVGKLKKFYEFSLKLGTSLHTHAQLPPNTTLHHLF